MEQWLDLSLVVLLHDCKIINNNRLDTQHLIDEVHKIAKYSIGWRLGGIFTKRKRPIEFNCAADVDNNISTCVLILMLCERFNFVGARKRINSVCIIVFRT